MFRKPKELEGVVASGADKKTARRAYAHLSGVIAHANVDLTTTNLERVQFYPSRQLGDLQSDIYRQYGYGQNPERPIPRSSVSLAKTAGASALYHASAMSLEYRAHRFIFTPDNGLAYNRHAFNVDCQSIGSRTLDLVGLDAIAANEGALGELDWLAHDLRHTRPTDWTMSLQTAHISVPRPTKINL